MKLVEGVGDKGVGEVNEGEEEWRRNGKVTAYNAYSPEKHGGKNTNRPIKIKRVNSFFFSLQEGTKSGLAEKKKKRGGGKRLDRNTAQPLQ